MRISLSLIFYYTDKITDKIMKICQICSNKQIFFTHKINKYFYYRCENCHTLFLNPLPLSKEINNYYKNNFSYTDGILNKEKIIKQAKKILKALKNMNANGKNLLDIGCGYGFFLIEAKKFGFCVEGIDSSKKLVDKVNKKLSLNIKNFSFSDYFKKNYKKKGFDFITLIHVIEHVRNPEKIIKMASLLLKKNGVLYIETPNLDSHLYNFEKENFTFLIPPEHIWIFSKKSFQKIINKFPELKIEKISTYSYPEHFMGIIKKILNINQSECINTKFKKIKNLSIMNHRENFNFKYYVFDIFLASILTPILNLNNFGSILELYIRKK